VFNDDQLCSACREDISTQTLILINELALTIEECYQADCTPKEALESAMHICAAGPALLFIDHEAVLSEAFEQALAKLVENIKAARVYDHQIDVLKAYSVVFDGEPDERDWENLEFRALLDKVSRLEVSPIDVHFAMASPFETPYLQASVDQMSQTLRSDTIKQLGKSLQNDKNSLDRFPLVGSIKSMANSYRTLRVLDAGYLYLTSETLYLVLRRRTHNFLLPDIREIEVFSDAINLSFANRKMNILIRVDHSELVAAYIIALTAMHGATKGI